MDICRNVDELQAKVNQDVETLLEGRKLFVRTLKSNTKILLLQDDKRGKSEVAIISGSGDAHGPTFANLIGPGLLTCAVRGTVSESPKSYHIVLAANALIHAGYSGGFLLIARNWHDDVKHFREAQEELKQSGSNVELVCVKDDCSHRQESDRRGLAGLFLIIKMAGACSQLGMSLEDIYKAVIDASKTLGTIGVSLPLKSAGDRRRSLRMEFGLGLDGEPGLNRDPIPLKALVEQIISQILSMITIPKQKKQYSAITSRGSCALLINMMGPAPNNFQDIVLHYAVRYLKDKESLIPVSLFWGAYVPSTDRFGFSISFMGDTSDSITRLKQPTEAFQFFWPKYSYRAQLGRSAYPNEVREHDATLRSLIQSGDAMNNCWVRSCIASDFLQTIIRGLLKLIHSYEKCGKYFSGILNVDNIGYKDSDIEDPYFLCDEGDSAASSSYYDDLESTIIVITNGIHKIAVPFELMMFCSLLSQSTKNGGTRLSNKEIKALHTEMINGIV